MADAPLMLSVSGLRGLIGTSLTPPVAVRYATAVGRWLRARAGAGTPPRVALGRDSRPSGPMIELAVASGLAGVGCHVTRLGVATTPGVGVMTTRLDADGALVITASHNPLPWNGIKTLDRHGAAPTAEAVAAIIPLFRQDDPRYVGIDELHAPDEDDSTAAVHVARVLARVDAAPVRRRRPRIVLDSVHGAGGPSTAQLLQSLGADVVHLHAEPTGRFPHEPEPVRENLGLLCEAVAREGADVGFAQDPDADRLALVDERGQYIGEEYTLALAAWHVLASAPADTQPVVVANLSTSRMIDDVAARCGGRVVRTPVGEANVAAAMAEHRAAVGGEGNGGVIVPEVGMVRDSLAGIALILHMLAVRDQTLSQLVAALPHYEIVKAKLTLPAERVARMPAIVRGCFPNAGVDEQDGTRVDWPDRWVHVRPSNTEPIVRIIAEAADAATAGDLVNRTQRALESR